MLGRRAAEAPEHGPEASTGPGHEDPHAARPRGGAGARPRRRPALRPRVRRRARYIPRSQLATKRRNGRTGTSNSGVQPAPKRAILLDPLLGFHPGALTEGVPLPGGAAVFENSTACAHDDPSWIEVQQVRPTRPPAAEVGMN
jgi:hypothetical protein